MTVSRYKLDGNANAFVSGTKLLVANNISSFPNSPAPPSSLTSCALLVNNGNFQDSIYYTPGLATQGGVWFDAYFYVPSGTGKPFGLGNFVAEYWGYAGTGLGIAPDGSYGLYNLPDHPTAQAQFATVLGAAGSISFNTWHRLRFTFPDNAMGSIKLFLGSNRHNVTESVSHNLWNFNNSGFGGPGHPVYWNYFNGGTTAGGALSSTGNVSDILYGVDSDAVPVRDGASSIQTHFYGQIPF